MKKAILFMAVLSLLVLSSCAVFDKPNINEVFCIAEEEQCQNYGWPAYDIQKGATYCLWKGQKEIYAENLETGESKKVAGKQGLLTKHIHNMIVDGSRLMWTEKGSYETDAQGFYVKNLSTGRTERICKEYAVKNILMADGVLYFSVGTEDCSASFYSYSFEQKKAQKLCTVPYGASGFYSWAVYNNEMFYAYMNEDDVYLDSYSVQTGERRLHIPSTEIFGKRDSLDCFKVTDGYVLCLGMIDDDYTGVIYDLAKKETVFRVDEGYCVNDCAWMNGKAHFVAEDEDDGTVYMLQVEKDGTVLKQVEMKKDACLTKLYCIDGGLYFYRSDNIMEDLSKIRFNTAFVKVDI